MTGRDSHSTLLQICGQQITATDLSQNCDSEFLATDLRAELALCQHGVQSKSKRAPCARLVSLYAMYVRRWPFTHCDAESL